MLAYRMHAVGEASLERVDDPRPDVDEVVVRPTIAGLCATDVHVLYHGALVEDENLPMTLGHEFVGEVVEVPSTARAGDPYPGTGPLEVGARVAVEPLVPCLTCYQCLRGRHNICLRMSHLGITRDGCFAEYVAVPALRAVPVPEGVSDRAAALVELVACGVNFVESVGMDPGDACVVVGAGPAGLATIQCAVAAGASTVVAVEPVAERRDLALRCGATHAVAPGAEGEALVAELTGGVGADVVFECVGVESAVNTAIAMTRGGGRVLLAGIPTQRPAIDMEAIVTRELRVVGAFASAWSFDRAISWIDRGLVDPTVMVTGETTLQDIGGALEQTMRDHTQGKLHVRVRDN